MDLTYVVSAVSIYSSSVQGFCFLVILCRKSLEVFWEFSAELWVVCNSETLNEQQQVICQQILAVVSKQDCTLPEVFFFSVFDSNLVNEVIRKYLLSMLSLKKNDRSPIETITEIPMVSIKIPL